MRKLLENDEYRKYVDLGKTLTEVRSKAKSKFTTRMEAEILCFQKEIKVKMDFHTFKTLCNENNHEVLNENERPAD